jgi:hypothetical protein
MPLLKVVAREKALGETIEAMKARVTQVTVKDII